MTVLLDTSVIINSFRNREGGSFRVGELIREGHLIAVSAITVGELYAGVRSGEERKIERFLHDASCYDVTERLAKGAGLLRNEWLRRGRTLELADMIIAATALDFGLAFMTDNRKDFPMAELRFYPE